MSPVTASMIVVVGLLFALAYGAGLLLGKRGEGVRDWFSTHTRHRVPPEPTARPIEDIATELRRLGGRFHGLDPRASYAKVEAVRAAYDRSLVECCTALGLSHLLSVLPPGPLLDDERRRVESVIAGSGVRLPFAA